MLRRRQEVAAEEEVSLEGRSDGAAKGGEDSLAAGRVVEEGSGAVKALGGDETLGGVRISPGIPPPLSPPLPVN